MKLLVPSEFYFQTKHEKFINKDNQQRIEIKIVNSQTVIKIIINSLCVLKKLSFKTVLIVTLSPVSKTLFR